jgi:hypothetical protein
MQPSSIPRVMFLKLRETVSRFVVDYRRQCLLIKLERNERKQGIGLANEFRGRSP